MKQKKILILSQYFAPEMGAPQTRLFETAKGLMNLGWDVSVVCALPNYPEGKIQQDYKGKWKTTENIQGITVHRYWLYASNSKKVMPRVLSMLSFSILALCAFRKVKKWAPDIVFTESPPLTLAYTGGFLARMAKAKHVVNISDLWPLSALELNAIQKGTMYSMLESMERYVYQKADGCTGQSQEIVDHIQSTAGKQAHLFRNSVDISRFDDIKQHATHAVQKIVYTGLLGHAQGILNICKHISFSEHHLEFHIYGDGAEKAGIESFIQTHPDAGITYHGKVYSSEIPGILKQYDLTLIPLIKEIRGAIPSKIYEAMAAGLPILFAAGGEGSKIIEKYKIGWTCEPSNFNQIQNTLAQITKMSPDELNTIKQNCRHTGVTVFNRQVQINQLHSYFDNLIPIHS